MPALSMNDSGSSIAQHTVYIFFPIFFPIAFIRVIGAKKLSVVNSEKRFITLEMITINEYISLLWIIMAKIDNNQVH